MSSGRARKRVVIVGAPAGHPATPPGGYPEGIHVEHAEAGAPWEFPLPVLVVGWLGGPQDVPRALEALRNVEGGAEVPVVVVMPTIQADMVARLKALGARRILMVEEMAMNWPSVVRAAA